MVDATFRLEQAADAQQVRDGSSAPAGPGRLPVGAAEYLGVSFRQGDFSTTVNRHGDESVIVILAGEFDPSTAPDLREWFHPPK